MAHQEALGALLGSMHAWRAAQGELAEIDQRIKEKSTTVQSWAEANPSEFGALKSLDVTHAVIGWRTGQPTLKTLAGWTWDRVLEKLNLVAASTYIRLKEEVNKAAILADRESLGAEKLRGMGMRVVQDESFFIEPKITETESTVRVEAA
jgi:phage host-nuclease inhibitor protein Gam